MDDRDELLEMLHQADDYLGGFMGSISGYREVEKLRERIREKLAQSERAQRKGEARS